MAKPLLIKTFKRIFFGLICVAILGAMFWYINTYIYQFYAASPTVTVDSSSTIAKVTQGNEFNVVIGFADQNIETIDLVLTFDKDKLSYQNTVTSLPANYFKNPPDFVKVTDAGGNKSQLRMILLANTNVQRAKSLTVNLKFKALSTGTATVTVDQKSVIAGTDNSNKAVNFEEDLTKANRQITIEAPLGSTKELVGHWRMDDNVNGNNQVISDSSGKNNHGSSKNGTNNQGVNCTINGKFGRGCSFDGIDDYVQVPAAAAFNFNQNNPFTIALWVRPTSSIPMLFVNKQQNTTNEFVYSVGINSANKYYFDVSKQNSQASTAFSSENVVVGQWTHIAAVSDGVKTSLYINGALQGQPKDIAFSGATQSLANLYFGQGYTNSLRTAGDLDDIRIYNYALTEGEIDALLVSNITVTPSVGPSTITPTPTTSPSVSPSVSPTNDPTPTPPWVNTDYTTTTVFGIVQDADENGVGVQGKYWRKDASVCANATYSNSAQMNINGNYLDKCQGFNNQPYFLTVVNNPGNNVAYQLSNLPEGYECVSWEHRLRIKSDGSPFTKAQGEGCSTGPLEIVVNNESSSYENSHLIWFKIRQVQEPTPTSPLEQFESVLNMTVKFQGIHQAPREQYRKLQVNVLLKGGGQDVKQQTVEFTAQTDGTWTGSMGVDGINAATKYELILKGAKHLAKKVCVNSPSEQLPGTYRCTEANVSLVKGENNLDFSNIILLGGDLPQQDGIINALDFAFVRQNLGSQVPDDLIRGDLNLDGIIDTQDHTIIKTALDFKYDED